MLSTSIVDVAIGLVFIFLLLSLVCTAVTEWISRIVAMRAKTLEKGLHTLLHEPRQPTSLMATLRGCLSALGAFFLPKRGHEASGSGTHLEGVSTDTLYAHPLIRGLYRPGPFDNWRGRSGKPSYIPSRAFAAAVIDLLVPANDHADPPTVTDLRNAITNLPDTAPYKDLKRSLLALLASAEKDVTQFRLAIEQWFDDSMERVEGWYKRNIQLVLFGVAVLVATVLNADTLTIGRQLWRDDALRASVTTAAQQYIASQPTPTAATPIPGATSTPTELETDIRQLQHDLDSLQIPLGWSSGSEDAEDLTNLPDDVSGWLAKVLGLALTAVALSLGAPFWFDLLNKVVNLRSTGAPPAPIDTSAAGYGRAKQGDAESDTTDN